VNAGPPLLGGINVGRKIKNKKEERQYQNSVNRREGSRRKIQRNKTTGCRNDGMNIRGMKQKAERKWQIYHRYTLHDVMLPDASTVHAQYLASSSEDKSRLLTTP